MLDVDTDSLTRPLVFARDQGFDDKNIAERNLRSLARLFLQNIVDIYHEWYRFGAAGVSGGEGVRSCGTEWG